MNIKPFRRSAALAVSVLLTALGAHAAGSFTIQSGNWVVTSELNGAPGRGMAIDVQDSLLVMQVYNYESSGQPTFHMSFGDLQGNHYQGTLKRYKNGRYYGSSPMHAMEDGDDGEGLIDFDSATSGTIQFPGEPAAPISRYKVDNVPDHQLSRVGTSERWLMAEIDANDTPIGALVVNVYTPSPRQTVLSSVRSRLDDDASTATNCTYAAATRQFTCPIDFGGGKTRTLTWSKHLEGMSGTISFLDGNFSPAVVRQRRVIGMRLGIDYGMATVNAQMDVLAAHMAPPFNYPAPDPGNWIVSSELNGKPGRGMAIDVQYDKLVMQVYNYETSGAATFHMAVADYQRGQATGRLMRYEGGRYYGGPNSSDTRRATRAKSSSISPRPPEARCSSRASRPWPSSATSSAPPRHSPNRCWANGCSSPRTAGAWPTSGWTVSLPPSLPRLAASSTSANTPMAKRCNATAIHPSTTTSSISSRSTAGPLARTP